MPVLPRARTALLLLTLVSLPAAAHPQAPGRARLAAYQDSLARAITPAAVTALVDAAHAAVRAAPGDGVLRTREGLALLRLAVVTSAREPLDQALATLDEAAYRAPQSPLPWYGLALAKLELDRRAVPVKASMHQSEGESWRHGALMGFSRSIGADSTFAPSAAALADLLMAAAEVDLDPAVQHAVRASLAARAGPDGYLAAARMQRALGHPDSTLVDLRWYLVAGGDSGVAGLESARSLFASGSRDSAINAYEMGAAHAGPAGRALYRADVAWVASAAELASFDSTGAATLGPWVNDFWRRRDVIALRPQGERLVEQLRRWNYVHEKFRIIGRSAGTNFSEGPGAGAANSDPALADAAGENQLGVLGAIAPDGFALLEGGQRVIDDRGVVYMRHGEPDARVAWPGGPAGVNAHGCIIANESWQYVLPTGTLLLNFCASRRLGTTAPTTLVAMLPLYAGLIDARGALDGRYQRLANQLQELAERNKINDQIARLNATPGATGKAAAPDLGALVSPQYVEALTESGRRQLATALHTDSYVQRYESSLKPVVQLYTAGAPGGADARLLVVFAIPGERLKPEVRPGVAGVIYSLSLRTLAVGPKGLDALRRDTTRFFRVADTLRAGAYLNGLMELPMPTGTYDVRVLLTQPGGKAAAAAGRDGMTLGRPATLAMSDLIAGREGSGLVWAHGGDPVALNPLDVYARTAVLDLYYDVSGMVPGTAYHTTIALDNTVGAAGDGVRVAFDDRASAAEQHVRRSIDLKTLKGGQYRLTVTVGDAGGGPKVTRERTVNVSEGPGK